MSNIKASKIIYIAHPISGNVAGNLEKIAAIGRDLNLNRADVVPIAPYFFDLECLNDNKIYERARGIQNNSIIIQSGAVDELWLYGDKISHGMAMEIRAAQKVGIPVIPMSAATKSHFKHYEN